MMKLFFVAALLSGVSGFSVQQPHAARTTLMMSSSSSSESLSRRDILSSAASVAALGVSALVIDPKTVSAASLRTGPITAQSAANKAAESYQGVYSDPNHPEGYRVIMASGKGARMTLCDGGSGDETYKNIPIDVNGNELSFDFGFSESDMSFLDLHFHCSFVPTHNSSLKQHNLIDLDLRIIIT